MDELARYPEVLLAAATLARRREALLDLCMQVQQIAAPTDAEQDRADWIEKIWQQQGLHDVHMDAQNNVYARIAGHKAQPAVMVSAHTDTVFPAATDLTLRTDKAQERVYG